MSSGGPLIKEHTPARGRSSARRGSGGRIYIRVCGRRHVDSCVDAVRASCVVMGLVKGVFYV